MLINQVINGNRLVHISAPDHSAQSSLLCSIIIGILIQLPAAVGGSGAFPMLDSAMT